MAFAENLKYIMQKLELTNYKLAKEIGCSQSSIKNWLDGDNIPHTKTRIKIAEHFGITLEELDGDGLPTLPTAAEIGEKIAKKLPATMGGELTDTQREAWELIQSWDDEKLKRFIAAAKAMLGE